MASDFDDPTPVDHRDAIRSTGCGEAMGDHHRGAPAQQHVESLLDLSLRPQVEVAGGLVEHQHPRLGHESARQRQQLPLASRQRGPPLMDDAVEAAETLHHILYSDGTQRLAQLGVARPRAGEAHVVAHRAREQERLLNHHPDLGPQAGEGGVAQVMAVDAHRAGRRVVQPHDESGDGRFARTGLAHQRDRLARRDVEAHIVKDLAVGAVREGHVVEDDLAAYWGEHRRAGTLRDARLGPEQILQLGDGRASLLVGVVELHQGLDRREEGGEEQQVGGELAHRDAAARGHGSAHRQQHRLGGDADRLAARPVEGVGSRGPQVCVAVTVHYPAVLGNIDGPSIVRGDHPDAGQRLLEVA